MNYKLYGFILTFLIVGYYMSDIDLEHDKKYVPKPYENKISNKDSVLNLNHSINIITIDTIKVNGHQYPLK